MSGKRGGRELTSLNQNESSDDDDDDENGGNKEFRRAAPEVLATRR